MCRTVQAEVETQMVQFKKYPIYVVYSRHNQNDSRELASRYNREAMKLEKEGARKNDPAMKAAARREYEWEKLVENTALTTEDSDPRYKKEADKYRTDVINRLKLIEAVPIGKTLLSMFQNDVYIVPRPPGGSYAAQTYPLDWDTEQGFAFGKGDSYIWFEPNSDFKDDVLFHELTHAYRYSVGKFNRVSMADNEYNTEEFYAHQLQNMYRSYKGLWLEFSYSSSVTSPRGGKWGTKQEIYDHFLSHDDFANVLKQFLDTDDFVRSVRHLRFPDYNPFRDYPSIQKQVDTINRMRGN